MSHSRSLLLAVPALVAGLASAQSTQVGTQPIPGGFGPGGNYPTLQAWQQSLAFQNGGYRCGTMSRAELQAVLSTYSLPASDCTDSLTNPTVNYSPAQLPVLEIPVVFHVIMNTAGMGNVSDTLIHSQITVLNEDFRAMAGTPGANGVDTRIQFRLATVDPQGNPTTGITRSTNDTWFTDMGDPWMTLNWDPSRYMNIYTNAPGGGLLGYATFPQSPNANTPEDRIVLLHTSVGRDTSAPGPYNLGRTGTHEVGHQLGIYHPFEGGCDTAAGCYASGDTLCDTPNLDMAVYGCPAGYSSCNGTAADLDNYMQYGNDACINKFTEEQARRMRCSVMFYRPNLGTLLTPGKPYCTANANSTGSPSDCTGTGTNSIGQNDLVLSADHVPAGSMGYFICSRDQAFVPNIAGTQGNLCVGANTGRYNSNPLMPNGQGVVSQTINISTVPQPTGPIVAMPGERWNFQLWYRDANPGSTSNFSTGYTVVFKM